MRFFTAAVALPALLAASAQAFITSLSGVAPASPAYAATADSTINVTFSTGSTKVPFADLTVTFGLSAAATHTPATLGVPLATVDLVATGHSDTAPGNFTLSIPLTSAELFAGSGAYILTAAIVRATGDPADSLVRLDTFSIAFNATSDASY